MPADTADPPAAAELRRAALDAWGEATPATKSARARALGAAAGSCEVDVAAVPVPPTRRPGRPARPALVHPRELPPRPLTTADGRAALLHAVAHIEFNAIDLALDACWRFAGLPQAYYRDWARIAGEEALHFDLVVARLADFGVGYGDLPAHDGLWAMAERTADDVLARMALVPRVLEARGLDVTPAMQRRLRDAGDDASAAVLDVILRDEVGHVAVGNRWYRHLCAARGLDPTTAFDGLARQRRAPPPRGPLNHAARRAAGFTDDELAALDRAIARPPTTTAV